MKLADLNINPDDKTLREFGVVALFGFGLAGVLVGLKWDAWIISYCFWTVGVSSCILGLTRPQFLWPLFTLMMIIAFPIGFIISNVVLLALYYFLFTPISLCFKIVGRDSLNRKLEPKKTTYWRTRNEEKPASNRFEQY